MRFVSSVVDAIVLRHPGKGDVEKVAQKSSKPVINAGDGIGEHPTQVKIFVQPYTISFLHRIEDKKKQYDLWLIVALLELNRIILQYFQTFLSSNLLFS